MISDELRAIYYLIFICICVLFESYSLKSVLFICRICNYHSIGEDIVKWRLYYNEDSWWVFYISIKLVLMTISSNFEYFEYPSSWAVIIGTCIIVYHFRIYVYTFCEYSLIVINWLHWVFTLHYRFASRNLIDCWNFSITNVFIAFNLC